MNMKFKATLLGLSIAAVLPTMNMAQTPVYLDTSKPIEERVKDALSRMTLEEKIAMTHAQSKFSSPGVPRLGIPEVWATDGPHGIRPEVFLYGLACIDLPFCNMESRNVLPLWEEHRRRSPLPEKRYSPGARCQHLPYPVEWA